MNKKPQDYTVLEDGFIHGIWQQKDDVIPMTDAQARMFLDHGRIALVKPETAKAAKA
jgi:hypothetical protein